MDEGDDPAGYNQFAWFYNRHWGEDFATRVYPVVERLVLQHIPPGGRILDLCCGTGHLAARMSRAGFEVTGVDASREMLSFALQNAPGAHFVQGDARTQSFKGTFHAVVSTYDSLNHMLTREELASVLVGVHQVLQGAGPFLFDLNMEEGFRRRWRGSFGIAEDDNACIVRSTYDPGQGLGRVNITMFRPEGDLWRRWDVELLERCYDAAEVRSMLGSAGFAALDTHYALADLGMAGDVGRTFFLARRARGHQHL